MSTYDDLISSVQKYNWTTDKLKQLFDLFLADFSAVDDSASVKTFSTATWTQIGTLTMDLTVDVGDLVLLCLSGRFSINTTSTFGRVRLAEDGTELVQQYLADDSTRSGGDANGISLVWGKAITSAGTYTYNAQAMRDSGANVVYFNDCQLLGFVIRKA